MSTLNMNTRFCNLEVTTEELNNCVVGFAIYGALTDVQHQGAVVLRLYQGAFAATGLYADGICGCHIIASLPRRRFSWPPI
jgi:hypothetical protein